MEVLNFNYLCACLSYIFFVKQLEFNDLGCPQNILRYVFTECPQITNWKLTLREIWDMLLKSKNAHMILFWWGNRGSYTGIEGRFMISLLRVELKKHCCFQLLLKHGHVEDPLREAFSNWDWPIAKVDWGGS